MIMLYVIRCISKLIVDLYLFDHLLLGLQFCLHSSCLIIGAPVMRIFSEFTIYLFENFFLPLFFFLTEWCPTCIAINFIGDSDIIKPLPGDQWGCQVMHRTSRAILFMVMIPCAVEIVRWFCIRIFELFAWMGLKN